MAYLGGSNDSTSGGKSSRRLFTMAFPNPAGWIPVGSRWRDEYGEVRVMTTCEGYAMVRRKGCMPFCVHHSDFGKGKRFERADPSPR